MFLGDIRRTWNGVETTNELVDRDGGLYIYFFSIIKPKGPLIFLTLKKCLTEFPLLILLYLLNFCLKGSTISTDDIEILKRVTL